MPMHTHIDSESKEIKIDLDDILTTDIEYLTDKKNVFNFSQIRNELESSIKFIREVKENFDLYSNQADPLASLQALSSTTKRMLSVFRELSTFVENYNIPAHLNNYSDSTSSIKKLQEDLVEKFRQTYADARRTLNLAMENERLEKENTNLTIVLEDDISKLYTTLFSDRASIHKTASRWWLGIIFALSVISTGYVFYLLEHFNNEAPLFGTEDYLNFFDHVALRVILFSLIAYALHFMSRAYSFNKTQQINNEDKDAALRCFPRFMRTSIKDDPELHRAVMLQITQSIFNSRDNKFSDGSKGDNVAPSTNLGLSLSKSD